MEQSSEKQTEIFSPHEAGALAESEARHQAAVEATMAPAFASFDFDATEVLTIYGALRTYNIALAQQDDLLQSERVLALLKVIRPVAARASQLFAQEGVTK